MGKTNVESAHPWVRGLRSCVLGCSLMALPPCDTTIGDGTHVVPVAPGASPTVDAATPTATTASARCLETGGLITERACCRTTEAFPSTCAAGTCDCPPTDAKVVAYCECGNVCFDPQFGCVDWMQ